MGLPAFLKKEPETLKEAKNLLEQMIEVYRKQQESIEKLQAEVARLKGQAKKPHFHKQESKASISVTKLLKTVKGIWKKIFGFTYAEPARNAYSGQGLDDRVDR